MKKVLFAMAIAGMFGFAACNNNKTVEEPATEPAVENVEAIAEEAAETVENAVEEVVANAENATSESSAE